MNDTFAAGISSSLQIQAPISDHETLAQFCAEKLGRLAKKPRVRLTAHTAFFRPMGAECIAIHRPGTLAHQKLIHPQVDRCEILQSNQASAYATLIGDDDKSKPSGAEPAKAASHTRKKTHLVWVTQVARIRIEGPIAIQKYESFEVLHPSDLTPDA